MYGVYREIVESGEFAGSLFSEADAYVARAVRELGAKPGNATTWRQLNTTHHITQVVADIAKVRGIMIKRVAANELDTQLSLSDRF